MMMTMEGSAHIEGAYRYSLLRRWTGGSGKLMDVCMLNPSKADATTNDPTILNLIARAKALNYSGIWVVNLFALRATDPRDLKRAPQADRLGPKNTQAIDDAIVAAARDHGFILAAWGDHGDLDNRAGDFLARAVRMRCEVRALGITKSGQPKHPLARGKSFVPIGTAPGVYIRHDQT